MGFLDFDIVPTLRHVFEDFPMHAFRAFVCKINGLPFEIVLDTSLDVPTDGFDWHWVLQFRCIEIDDHEVRTERERQRLEGITIKVVNHLASQLDFKFVGSTTYKANHELLFYSTTDGRSKLGGTLLELKYAFPDDREFTERLGPEARWRASKDTDWESVAPYYKALERWSKSGRKDFDV